MKFNRYGLGLIEKKQERFQLAEFYFKQALEISPENNILKDSLALVIQQSNPSRYEESLELFDEIIKKSPENKIFVHHRALLLFDMKRYEEVIEVMLKETQNSKPQCNVYFLLGKAFAKIGKKQDAIKAMTFAQDFLQHKSSSIIKDFIGK